VHIQHVQQNRETLGGSWEEKRSVDQIVPVEKAQVADSLVSAESTPLAPVGGAVAPFLAREREALLSELREARGERLRPTGWARGFGVGPAGLAAVILAFIFRRPELAAAFLSIGIAVEVRRQWRLANTIRGLLQALQDPMDGS